MFEYQVVVWEAIKKKMNLVTEHDKKVVPRQLCTPGALYYSFLAQRQTIEKLLVCINVQYVSIESVHGIKTTEIANW